MEFLRNKESDATFSPAQPLDSRAKSLSRFHNKGKFVPDSKSNTRLLDFQLIGMASMCKCPGYPDLPSYRLRNSVTGINRNLQHRNISLSYTGSFFCVARLSCPCQKCTNRHFPSRLTRGSTTLRLSSQFYPRRI
jgi:hypothetical protein